MAITESRVTCRIDNEATWQRINPTLMRGEPAVTIATDSVATIQSTGSSSPYAGLTLTITKDNLTYYFVFTSATSASTNFNVSVDETFTSGNYSFKITSISHVWCAPRVKWGRGDNWGSTPYMQSEASQRDNKFIVINSGEGTPFRCDANQPGPFLLTPGVYKETSSGVAVKINGIYGIVYYSSGQVNSVSVPMLLGSTGSSTISGMNQKAITDALNGKVSTSALTSDYTQSVTSKVPTSKALFDGLGTKATPAQVASALNSALAISSLNANLAETLNLVAGAANSLFPRIEYSDTYASFKEAWNNGGGVDIVIVDVSGRYTTPVNFEGNYPDANGYVILKESTIAWVSAEKFSYFELFVVSQCLMIGVYDKDTDLIYPQARGWSFAE